MTLTSERMMELGGIHEMIEFREIDGLKDTLIENPVYYWFPNRLRIEGWPAVREMYARMQPLIQQLKVVTEAGGRGMPSLGFGEDTLTAEVEFHYTFPDGSTKQVWIAAFIHFEGEKMVGETQYVDSALAAELDRLFGEDFVDLPGVSIA